MPFQFAFVTALLTAHWLVIADGNFDEAKMIEKIELLGGKVTRDETLLGHPVVGISFFQSSRLNDKYLHLLNAFENLTTLDLNDVQITNEGLVEIGKLQGL